MAGKSKTLFTPGGLTHRGVVGIAGHFVGVARNAFFFSAVTMDPVPLIG